MASAKDRKCANCPTLIYRDSITGLCAKCLAATKARVPADKALAADRERARLTAELSEVRGKYNEARKQVSALEQALDIRQELDLGLDTFDIKPRAKGDSKSEATVVWAASDWHVEERVNASSVSGLNSFTMDDARRRGENFFKGGLRLTDLLRQDIQIDNVVLALLGDFISNDIHEEVSEVAAVAPMHAILFAQNLIASGIEFILEHSDYTLTIPCHSGNHARTTKTTRFATENGHSLEFLMYHALAAYFRKEERVKFLIPDGYHSYLDIYGHKLRFHHGHAINYQGGIGGIFIPAFKAIGQWDKARQADLDVFGHFHQCKDGGKFISNGSLIGYNAYALSIKADYEEPKQQLFMIDKTRGRTCTWPILLK
jgi:hypothetical protein